VSLTLALALLLPVAQEKKIEWRKDYDAALEDAKKAGKYVLVHFTGPDCPACKQMDADTYSNAGVIEFSNKSFVNVGLSTDRDEKLGRAFGVDSIPVTFLLSPEGERLSTWVGYVGPEDYKKGIEKSIAAYQKLKELEPSLKAKPEDVDLLKQAASLYVELSDPRRAADAYKKAAAKAAAAPARGELLALAFKQLNQMEAAPKVNAEMLEVAAQFEQVDPDGKLGFRDDAAYARAMVDFNQEAWEKTIKGLEELLAKFPDGDMVPYALLNLGDLYHHVRKDHAKAEKALKTILEKHPKSEAAPNAKALLEHMKAHQDK
jgi:tetratricopeptide (TPR) repeat protein